MNDKLYGLPDAESMHRDPASVYEDLEADIDFADPVERVPFVIEEWTAVGLGALLGKHVAGRALERIGDDLADEEVSEGAVDSIQAALDDAAVVKAFERAVDVLRTRLDRTGWMQARDKVRDLTVTWTDDGDPLLDGEPMYVKRGES